MTNDGNKLKKFIDWVNADENLPAPEATGHEHDGHGHELDAHANAHDDDHDGEHSGGHEASVIKINPEEAVKKFRGFYAIASSLLTLVIIVTLLITITDLPKFGGADNPAVNEVYIRYVEKDMEETGAVNTVAGMLLDYRAFDTLGESLMLFTAAMGVIMLIRTSKDSDLSGEARKERRR